LLCPKCGLDVTGGAESCPACGEPIPDPSSASQKITSPTPGLSAVKRPVVYAGFWLRALAYLIDYAFLTIVVGFVIVKPLVARAGVALPDKPWVLPVFTRQLIAIDLLSLMAAWLYFASFESSTWQATPGKKMLGLRVTDLNCGRVSFARASARYFGKIPSAFIFLIGFLMAGFTEKKQALHDMLAGCLVVKKI
jgi:uncharacterized RDD family membrane protein YckC